MQVYAKSSQLLNPAPKRARTWPQAAHSSPPMNQEVVTTIREAGALKNSPGGCALGEKVKLVFAPILCARRFSDNRQHHRSWIRKVVARYGEMLCAYSVDNLKLSLSHMDRGW